MEEQKKLYDIYGSLSTGDGEKTTASYKKGFRYVYENLDFALIVIENEQKASILFLDYIMDCFAPPKQRDIISKIPIADLTVNVDQYFRPLYNNDVHSGGTTWTLKFYLVKRIMNFISVSHAERNPDILAWLYHYFMLYLEAAIASKEPFDLDLMILLFSILSYHQII